MSGHDVSAAPAICASRRQAKRMEWDFKKDLLGKENGVGIISIGLYISANEDRL
jgi:hypothetical protein